VGEMAPLSALSSPESALLSGSFRSCYRCFLTRSMSRAISAGLIRWQRLMSYSRQVPAR